ncbi:MAG TPA: NAD-dependent epimerase/dehydratase family protein [Gaiellaceae bacterium]|nr:NAD-dependent epimerase/dehydratase family protein [Gaiellaceae bacterium]
MKLLVTGGSGFIGSHVVDKAGAAGHEAIVFDTRKSPYGAETILGDVTNFDEVAAAAAGCDAILHLAAMADVNEVAKAPVMTEAVNAQGTLAVLEAARVANVRRVVYASTIWVYGEQVEGVATEDSPLGIPRHFYTATKLAGEMYCHSYGELYGLEHTILRFGIPYGPRAREAAVLPAFVIKAHAGEPLTIAGTGEQSRRFVYVEDLADGVVAALVPAAANRIYNLVGDESVTIREIAELVQQLVQPVEIVHLEGRKGDFPGVEVSGERAARELGWRATTSFVDGARRYVDWFMASTSSAADGSFAKSA